MAYGCYSWLNVILIIFSKRSHRQQQKDHYEYVNVRYSVSVSPIRMLFDAWHGPYRQTHFNDTVQFQSDRKRCPIPCPTRDNNMSSVRVPRMSPIKYFYRPGYILQGIVPHARYSASYNYYYNDDKNTLLKTTKSSTLSLLWQAPTLFFNHIHHQANDICIGNIQTEVHNQYVPSFSFMEIFGGSDW